MFIGTRIHRLRQYCSSRNLKCCLFRAKTRIFRSFSFSSKNYLSRRRYCDLSRGTSAHSRISRKISFFVRANSTPCGQTEPTNDLDIETLDVLQQCLSDFDGGIIIVTHDRYFLDQVATEIIAFPDLDQTNGSLIKFADLSQWETWRNNNQILKSPKKTTEVNDSLKKKKKMSYHEVRELSLMEGKIQEAEAVLEQLQAESSQPDIQSNSKKLTDIYQAIAEAQEKVEQLYQRWSELEAKSSGSD
ncbi:MAG: hypothetical protein EBR01_01685 [Proteobacteria bacterium]|nr:hypothetical protein [Pseudomonadota bacterium]